MDKLAGMNAFVEIVDRGSMTAAASSLGRSLPTVVRTLALLEEDLGAKLLHRTTRRMSLTGEGRVYLERCRRILADIEEAERALDRGAAEPRGEVRVTAPVLFGTWHVAPAVNAFLHRYAEVRVDLILQDHVTDILEESIDVAVRIGALADSSMIALRVGSLRQVVCASPKLLEEVGEPRHPKQLADQPCVRFDALSPGGILHFREEGRDLPVRITGAFACNQAMVAAEACAAGLGFTPLLSYQAEPKVRSGEIQVVLEDFELPTRPVSLVYPDARLMSSRVRVFIDWMRDALAPRPEL